MMTLEKPKKRGRPSQLLQVAELHGFVEFLLEKDPRTELQNQVIDVLQTGGCNFEMLSEAQQILVKEALKPYREHIKLKLLFDELSILAKPTEYETKFIELFQAYQNKELDLAETNILKTMCTRYYRFKAQQLQLNDLELYLSQIQKKDAGKKRKAENQRKFAIGGAVLAAFKKLNIDISDETPEQIINRIMNTQKFHDEVLQSEIFKEVLNHKKDPSEAKALFLDVLKGLATWEEVEIPIYYLEIDSILKKQ